MIKFDLGLPPDIAIEKEVMPRLSNSGVFYVVRQNGLLQVFSVGGFVFQYEVPENDLPEAILFKEGKHGKHIVECYREGKDILIPYEVLTGDEIPELQDYRGYEVIGGASFEVLQAVMHSASTDNIKPIFKSVCLYSGKRFKGVASTDSRRVSFYECNISGLEDSVMVPLDFVKIARADIEIIKEGREVFARSGNIISKIIDGIFPNLENVIPEDKSQFQYQITVKDGSKLKEYFNILAVQNTVIVFQGDNKIQVMAGDSPELELEYDSNFDKHIGFNFQFLLDALKVSKTFKIMNSTGPVLFENKNQIEVVMPIHLKSVQEDSKE